MRLDRLLQFFHLRTADIGRADRPFDKCILLTQTLEVVVTLMHFLLFSRSASAGYNVATAASGADDFGVNTASVPIITIIELFAVL